MRIGGHGRGDGGWVYHRETSAYLTEAEETMLATRGLLNRGLPVKVDEGYLTAVVSVGSAGRQDRYYQIGRGQLYEDIALDRLQSAAARGTRLRGLYYPGATPAELTLHSAALYFDETFVIHPGSVLEDSRHPYGDADEAAAGRYRRDHLRFRHRLEEFNRAVLPLKQAGVLYAIPPQMQEEPDFIQLITADLDNREFLDLAARAGLGPAFVSAKKMEPLLPLVGEGLATPEAVREELAYRSRYGAWGPGERANLFRRQAYGVKEVHPTLAATILLNHALLLADRFDLIPFTDDLTSESLLRCKLRSVAERPGYSGFREELRLGSAALSMRVLEEHLPRFAFANAADVLEARAVLAGPLTDFRETMRSLAAEIEESPYSPTFRRQVERVVATRVRPALTALERELRTSRESFVARTLRNARVGSVPVVASIFVGLPPAAVVGISAGVLTFEAAMETYLEIRAKKRNGLVLLLEP